MYRRVRRRRLHGRMELVSPERVSAETSYKDKCPREAVGHQRSSSEPRLYTPVFSVFAAASSCNFTPAS